MGCGAPLLAARAPRAYLDLNRAADELDPAVIEGIERAPHNPRVTSGLGVIPRVVAGGRNIYRGKLSLPEAEQRITRLWHPYHRALRDLVGDALGHQTEWIAVPVQRLSANFFELRSGMAGQWLQMLVNYRLRFAVLGDVSAYRAQSESLDAWITECNRGRDGCFVADWDALLARLPASAS